MRTRAMAGGRQSDVYVGVDVFGRGDVVSGGFDINKVGSHGEVWELNVPRI